MGVATGRHLSPQPHGCRRLQRPRRRRAWWGGAPWPGPAPGAAQGIRPRSDDGPTALWPSTPGASSDWARRVRGQGEDFWAGPVSIPVNLVRASMGAGERRGEIRKLSVRSLFLHSCPTQCLLILYTNPYVLPPPLFSAAVVPSS